MSTWAAELHPAKHLQYALVVVRRKGTATPIAHTSTVLVQDTMLYSCTSVGRTHLPSSEIRTSSIVSDRYPGIGVTLASVIPVFVL